MGLLARLLGLNNYDTVVAVGGDDIHLVTGVNGTPAKMPAYVAYHKPNKRVLAVGEEAKRMYGKAPANIGVVRFTHHGGFGTNFDFAESALRYAYRTRPRSPIVSPRVVVLSASAHLREVKDVCVHAGAREVVTMMPVMGAALGIGLPVDAPELQAVFVLERDWCTFGLISLSGLVVHFTLPLGTDALLEDVALHAMATRNVALDIDALHETFLASGLAGGEMLGWEAWWDELETGRVTSAAFSEKDLSRSALPFVMRLRWHYARAMEQADKAKMRDGAVVPVHLCSPYAALPGVTALVGRIFQREVKVPPDGDSAVVRGGQAFLRNLDELYHVAANF